MHLSDVPKRSAKAGDSLVGQLRLRSLSLCQDSGLASIGGGALPLTAGEAATLGVLLRRRGTPMSREAIVGDIQARGGRADARMIDIQVARLRRKLAPHGLDDLIVTEWGRGYLVADECDATASAEWIACKQLRDVPAPL